MGEIQIKEVIIKEIESLCKRFPDREWSGIILYKKNPKGILIHDILLMDIGNKDSTTFSMQNPQLALMLAEESNWESSIGMIHSHHEMDAYFSLIDKETFRSEVASSALLEFLSIVVNNRLDYQALYTSVNQNKDVTKFTYEIGNLKQENKNERQSEKN